MLSELINTCHSEVKAIPDENINAAQREDEVISRVVTFKQQHESLWYKETLKESASVKSLLTSRCKTTSTNQLVVPASFKPVIFKQFHEEMDNLSWFPSPERERFYWPKMRDEIEHYVTRVYHCLEKESQTEQKDTFTMPAMSAPFEMISIDYLCLEKTEVSMEYIFLIVRPLCEVCTGLCYTK